MKSVALLCALLAANLRVPAAEKLAGGPFVVNVGPRSATLVWIVGTGEATLGTEPGKADKTAPVLRAEKVAYTGLQPAPSTTTTLKGLMRVAVRSRRPRVGQQTSSSPSTVTPAPGTTCTVV
jgi:hypothetical protein